jgi:hypothetical protein
MAHKHPVSTSITTYRNGTEAEQNPHLPPNIHHESTGMLCHQRSCFWQWGQNDLAGFQIETGVLGVGMEPSYIGSYFPSGRRYAHTERKLPIIAPKTKQYNRTVVACSIKKLQKF